MLRFKKLYFAAEHVPLIKSKTITTTWRLFDHGADLDVGDTVKLFNAKNGVCFGKAKITSVVDKKLSEIDAEDKIGHEGYETPKEMYAVFTNFYQREVGPSTPVRVIKFSLLD